MKTRENGRAPGAGRKTRRRGSALITVLLVVLVLTVVGLGVAYFSSTEDRTSGNAKMSRVGFYAAEAGLRDGESRVTQWIGALGGDISAMLTTTNPADVYIPPGGGRPAYPLKIATSTFKNVVIAQDLGDPDTCSMYTLFVRNNQEDPGGDNFDTDKRINIIAVGQMVLVDSSGNPVLRDGVPTIGITKVLEEQLELNPEGAAAATQKGANVGGTSAGAR